MHFCTVFIMNVKTFLAVSSILALAGPPEVVCLIDVTGSSVEPDCGDTALASVSGPAQRHLTITRVIDHVSKNDEGRYNIRWRDSDNITRFCTTEVKIEEDHTVTPQGQTEDDSEKEPEEREDKSCTESNVRTAIIAVVVVACLFIIGITIVCFRQNISELYRTITGRRRPESSVPTSISSPTSGPNGAACRPGNEDDPMMSGEDGGFEKLELNDVEANGHKGGCEEAAVPQSSCVLQ